jgi:Lipocalin-like domain
MKLHSIFTFLAIVVFGLGLLSGGTAVAQQRSLRDQLIGTWTLVSWEQTRPDGTKIYRFGSNPKGINTFDADGHFSVIILHPNLPKVASGDASKMTPDEARAIAGGTIAYFGTYAVNEAERILSLRIAGTTLVNQLGIDAKRLVTMINANEMKYRNPTSVGGGQIELVWTRAK